MSEGPPRQPGNRAQLSLARVTVWVVVGGIGLFLLISGIVGIIAKG